MHIKMSKFKLYVVALATMTMSLTATVFAAQEEAKITVSPQQPYLIAFTAADATLNTEDIKIKVINDAFIAASYVPVSSTPPTIHRIGAGVANSGSGVVVRTMCGITSTGYNSLVEQTDSTPFIAADGTHVFDGMVAANFLKFKTKIRIPAYYGDKVFTVHDRMAERFSDRVDIWFEHKHDALQWGKRTICIEILG